MLRQGRHTGRMLRVDSYHDGLQGLTPPPAGDADHRRLPDLFVQLQHAFDLQRKDVLATSNNLVALAPPEVEEPLVINATEISGPQPTIGIWLEDLPGPGHQLAHTIVG